MTVRLMEDLTVPWNVYIIPFAIIVGLCVFVTLVFVVSQLRVQSGDNCSCKCISVGCIVDCEGSGTSQISAPLAFS